METVNATGAPDALALGRLPLFCDTALAGRIERADLSLRDRLDQEINAATGRPDGRLLPSGWRLPRVATGERESRAEPGCGRR